MPYLLSPSQRTIPWRRPLLPLPALGLAFVFLFNSARADWPQWRGPERNGAAPNSPPLASAWPKDGPPRLWTSEEIPRDSGEGSVVVAGGRAYVFVNWWKDIEIPTRKLDDEALRRLRWFDQGKFPEALLASLEKARTTRPGRLRGGKLTEWVDAWLSANIPAEQKRLRGTAERRLKDGKNALSLQTLTKLGAVRDRVFADEKAFETWLDEQAFDEDTHQKVLGAVTSADRVAQDVILCLDLEDGKTLWKRSLPGKPDRKMASATPTIDEGKLYFLGTTHAHCLEAESGKPVWATPLPSGPNASCLVRSGELLVGFAGHLVAFDRQSGKLVWENEKLRGSRSSPARWSHDKRDYILAHSANKTLACVDPGTGGVLWTVPAGGDSSPVVAGDIAVVHTNSDKLGLVAYRLEPEGATELWKQVFKGRGASTPIVHGGRVHLMGSERMVCADLETGELHWNEKMRSEISSPFLADGKLFAMNGNGSELLLFDASPRERRQLAESRLRAARCPSPAFAGGRILLRHKEFIACYDLRSDMEPRDADSTQPARSER